MLPGNHGEDVQYSTDNAAFTSYVAKYVAKFSDAFAGEILADDAGLNGDATAAAILCHYKPMEPEMILQLFAQHFPQWKVATETGGSRDFYVPWPEQKDMCRSSADAISAYEACDWRREDMSLLEFLRKTDDRNEGGIVQWLVRKHQAEVAKEGYRSFRANGGTVGQATWLRKVNAAKREHDQNMTLRDYLIEREGVSISVPDLASFANNYQMQGEKSVCCYMRSRLNDLYYGQWMVMHVPFRCIKDLIPKDIEAVPSVHRNLAIAVCSRHPVAQAMWNGPEANLHEDMRREGDSKAHRESVMNYFRTHRALVLDYVAGVISAEVDKVGIVDGRILPGRLDMERTHWLPTQERFARHIPDVKDVEGRVRMGKATLIKEGDVVQFGSSKARVLRVHEFDDFRTMLETLGPARAIPEAKSLASAVKVYHSFKNYERMAAHHGVLAFELGPATAELKAQPLRLHPRQHTAVEQALTTVGLALHCHNASTERERDIAREEAWERNKMLVIDGPPGTGKSFVQHLLVKKTLAQGGKVLYTFLTANHASRAREVFGDAIDIDTFHGALGDGSDKFAKPEVLQFYSLVMVDECFLLDEKLFLHLNDLYTACGKVPCVVLAGDKHQMGSPGGRPCFMAPQFKRCTRTITLVYDKNYQQRSNDAEFIKMLTTLRLAKPQKRGGRFSVAQITRGHKAWSGDEPSVQNVRELFRKHPETTVLTISRASAARFNGLALTAFFGRQEPLGTLDGDVESNPDNYNRKGKLLSNRYLRPWKFKLYKGMQVSITKNICKDTGFVNGVQAVVEDYDSVWDGVRLLTTSGKRLTSYRKHDPDLGGVAYHCLRPGYCTTIIKVQGAELKHVTVWLDVPGVPGAAYTALSRVRAASDYLIGGNVNEKHFTPAIEGWTVRYGPRAFARGAAGRDSPK